MRAIRLSALLLFAVAGASLAQGRWRLISVDAEGNSWFIDGETLRKSHTTVAFWAKVVLSTSRMDTTFGVIRPFNEQLVRYRADCSGETLTPMNVIRRDAAGGQVYRGDIALPAESPEPGTMHEEVLRFVCARPKGRQER